MLLLCCVVSGFLLLGALAACGSRGLSAGDPSAADAAALADLASGGCVAENGVCAPKAQVACPRTRVGDPAIYPCGDPEQECCLPFVAAQVCNLPDDQRPCKRSNDCDPFGAICSDATAGGPCVCAPRNCDFGQDRSCNDDPSLSALRGACNAAGACNCFPGAIKNPSTGKCR
jgi:hypothetical protein